MTVRIRSLPALLLAGAVLFFPVRAAPSSNKEAGRAYDVAVRRLADLRKSPRKNRYRSYWFDSIRAFEQIERKYPKSWYAADACFYRADIYRELYQHSRFAKDITLSLEAYAGCRAAHPRHPRAAEALYRIVEIALYYKKDADRAGDACSLLSQAYPRSRWTSKAHVRLKQAAPAEFAKRRQARQSARCTLVKDIRYRSSGDYTRIVIDHDQKTDFHVLELKDPPRLVFDLLNAHLGTQVDREPLMVNDGILRQVRASQYEPETVRVVLDLASIKSYAAFPLRDPQRLVIDVTGDANKSAGPAAAADEIPRPPAASGQAAGSGTETGPAATGRAAAGSGAGFSLSRQLGLKIRTIAIDAGHGGHDPGAIGRRGTKEKNITLDIAKRLAALVKEGTGCRVVMTRNTDVFIPLEDRPAIARTKGADLFVSVHVNANRKRRAKGIETYIQGLRTSDRDAMETAARENATTSKTLNELDDELSRILTGLRIESNDEDSIHLAHEVQGALVSAVKPLQGRVPDLGVKRAFFYVLINTGMPSVLAEVGFISNPAEEALLKTKSYRQAIAGALYHGLKTYIESREPQIAKDEIRTQ